MIDTNRFFYDGVNFKGKNYTISWVEAKVFRDEYSNDDQGSIIPFVYETKQYYISGGTFKNTLRESRTLLDMNTIAEVKQDIDIDWAIIDSKTIDNATITATTESIETWIGTQEIGLYSIWMEWPQTTSFEDSMNEVIILRTKWALNRKWRKIKRRRTMNSVGWRIRLKEVTPRLETLPPRATPLTR